MNRRGFFAALAGLPLAPVALKAEPTPLEKAWVHGEWQLVMMEAERTGAAPFCEETWRIPEWQEGWKKMGARHAYIQPNDPCELPHYKEALEAAKKAGTAIRVA